MTETITRFIKEGQAFYDEPVYAKPKDQFFNPISASVSTAFNGEPALPRRILLTHERVRLRWMKPGPDGKLVPKYPDRKK